VHTSPACTMRSAVRRCAATGGGHDFQRRGPWVSDKTTTRTRSRRPVLLHGTIFRGGIEKALAGVGFRRRHALCQLVLDKSDDGAFTAALR
jgi:hypothetical protein